MLSLSKMATGLSWSNKGLQSVCPTGISTLDQLIGGGFALSSLNVIDEDCDRTYSSMVTKAYLSSAIIAGQDLIIFSNAIKNKNSRFLKELPLLQTSINSNPINESIGEDSMKIAFRYANLPSRHLDNIGENFSSQKLDYGEYLNKSLLDSATIDFYDHNEILSILKHRVKKFQSKSSSKVCRILIDQIGTPLSLLDAKCLPKLFYQIKVLMRRLPNFVCLATMPSDRNMTETGDTGISDLLESLAPSVRDRIHSLSDAVIRLTAFDDSQSDNPYSDDYVGLLRLLRLPRINSLASYNPTLETTEFGIKLRNSKRYLAIEKLALPPDLGETVNRFSSSAKGSENLACANTFVNF